ncbi:inorganic phosphate transporter [Pyrococcus horikoshii]|uniref:Inorganic phosphate transporter n=2 Tax=Pyrococcus horikoshii TaxID=53953 RepID=A0A832SNU8_PYRHR|nr:inorganic phosphate transporter [Pyrococcus horikoshii]BAA30231.1 318aa long hypothetical sodium dependent phosphate transporter [Pyrococcus horikoshii OT3]HII61827.1 inorganic phosphate transporter [Pyrococcus horikoshii]
MDISLVLLSIAFYIAWNIGANGSANAMGVVVGSGILSFRQAVLTIAVFTLLGAYLRGEKVMETVGRKVIYSMTPEMAIVILLSAGLCATIATLRGLPISVTQTIVGGVVGVGLALGVSIQWKIFEKVIIAWILSPILSGIFAFMLYYFYYKAFKRIKSVKELEILYKGMAIAGGSYMAFNFGANEVANAVSPLIGAGILTYKGAGIFGALSLAIGSLTFSYPVMYTVGKKITALGPISAFSAQFGSAISVSLANYFGLPVSSGQAIIGGIIGASIAGGGKIKQEIIERIISGWILAPVIGITLSYAVAKLFVFFNLLS